MAEGTAEPGVVMGGRDDMPRGPGTILVVDDEDAVRYLACRVLRGNGYRVLEAGDPAAALGIVRAEGQPVDLLVTDIVMPGMSGPALAERLVAGWPDLKVLYITGYAEEAIERQGTLPAGGALLEKPFTAQQLADSVRQALANEET
jgi:two-component system cell cycle sensor histidine kinase/response regulator CckA